MDPVATVYGSPQRRVLVGDLMSPIEKKDLTRALVSPDPLMRRIAKLLLVSSKQEARANPPKRIWFMAFFLLIVFSYQMGSMTSWRFGGLVHRVYDAPHKSRFAFSRESQLPGAEKSSLGAMADNQDSSPSSPVPSPDPAHEWTTHQTCYSAGDESEICVYSGPVCTDGKSVYVGTNLKEAAWDGKFKSFPPWGRAGLGCWDMRTLELTSRCEYSAAADRRVGSGEGYWSVPLGERLSRGGWGPMGLLSSVIPIYWKDFADALHSGQHRLVDPTVHWLPVGREWDTIMHSDVPPASPEPLQCPESEDSVRNSGGGKKRSTGGGEGEEDRQQLHLHWIDGALWMTHMSVGWIAHPWHFASSAFPLWTARRRNYTALHVPRSTGTAGSKNTPPHTVPFSPPSGGEKNKGDVDDGSLESELVLTYAGGVKFPPMDYLAILQDPEYQGLNEEGSLAGNLGDETPGRQGRGLGDYPVWQRGAFSLLLTPRGTNGDGARGTTFLTPRTIAETLGVSPTAGAYATWSKPPLFDAQADQCPLRTGKNTLGQSGGADSQEGKATTSPLPRLMCSKQGAVLTGLQPRLFASLADAHAFRLAAWEAAGVLDARAAAGTMAEALKDKNPLWWGLWEGDTGRFLRGAKSAKARKGTLPAQPQAAETAAAGADAVESLKSKVQWWSQYPPRMITVINRQATRSFQPLRPFKALLRHVGLPVRWVHGMGNKGWDEQVSLFSSTGILISSHGGDLAGIPFLPPSASVIEAFPYLMDWEGYRRVPPRARAHTTHMIAHTHVQGQ